MIKSILFAGASAAALAFTAPALAEDAESTAPEMVYGTWGVEPATIDKTVDPGDNFFDYVNGKWVAENTIPADKARFGAFDALGEASRDDVKTLVDELVASNPAPGTGERRIVDAYNAFLNVEAIDASGLVPAYPYLAEIFNAGSLNDLAKLFPKPGYASMVAAGVSVDDKDPNSYIVSVGFDGMGLPDRDYYLVDSERNEGIRAAYMDYLTLLFDKAGYADAAGTASAVYAFEKQVAELEWDRTALRNSDITYNKLTRDEFMALAGDFPLATVLEGGGFGDQDVFLAPQIPPSAEKAEELGLSEEMLAGIGGGTPAMMKLLTETQLPVLKAYMAKSFLSSNAAVLTSELDAANFAFFGTKLSGQEEQQPRWKRAISATQGQLGEVLGKTYVERYFPPESKAAMDELVANLRKAMAQSIAEIDWMTPETKVQAVAKLNSFNPKIGYPDKFETYEGLEVAGDNPLGNRMSAAEWTRKDNLANLGKPVDKTEWFMLPQTVNAYYNPVFNEIVFPAAILQRPFFSASNDPAVNYGAIGGVIGHEMGHGFDDQGAKYDATGTLKNWWADSDLERFSELGDMLAAQYDAYCPYDEGKTCVNGRFTLGENIGDVGGLSMAYRAYRLSLNGEEAPVIDGLTGDQRFFLAWGQVWRSMQREAMGRQRLQVDPHSPEEFRVNGAVRNLDAWYDAFNVTEGDDLYLPPEERVRIW